MQLYVSTSGHLSKYHSRSGGYDIAHRFDELSGLCDKEDQGALDADANPDKVTLFRQEEVGLHCTPYQQTILGDKTMCAYTLKNASSSTQDHQVIERFSRDEDTGNLKYTCLEFEDGKMVTNQQKTVRGLFADGRFVPEPYEEPQFHFSTSPREASLGTFSDSGAIILR